MEVQLSQQSEATIARRVSTGLNRSAEEAIDEALVLLEDEAREKLSILRKAVQEGLDSGEDGPWDPAEVVALARRIREQGEVD